MGANLFGIDVRALDVGAFLGVTRALFPLLALTWLALHLRVRRAWWLVLGAILANAWAWFITNYPLQRIYGLGPSSDRLNNLALAEVAAAGNSPLRTAQVGQLHFEPFWSVFAAAASGFDPERLLAIYPFFPFLALVAVTLSFFLALRPDAGSQAWSATERALVAGFATLLCSAPLDSVGTYRTPWALTFLLKPNHALGFVIVPWVVRVVARSRTTRDRLFAGFLLHVLGWVWVIHMAAVSLGLVVFALLSLHPRRRDAETPRRAVLDVAVTLGVSLVMVSPYVVILLTGYQVFARAEWLQIAPRSPHLLEAVTRPGWLFVLGAWGAVVAWRRDRLGRVWAAQLAGAYVLWTGYYLLHVLRQVKESDDVYYFLRVLLAASAAIGAWDLATRLAARLPALADPARRAASVAVLCVPFVLPSWWDPSRMDAYFPESLVPLAETQTTTAAYLRRSTPRTAVVVSDPTFARWAAALSGRRVLRARNLPVPPNAAARLWLEEALAREVDGEVVRNAARPFGVTYLAATPAFLAGFPGVTLDDLEARAHLRLVHFAGSRTGEYVALFELVG